MFLTGIHLDRFINLFESNNISLRSLYATVDGYKIAMNNGLSTKITEEFKTVVKTSPISKLRNIIALSTASSNFVETICDYLYVIENAIQYDILDKRITDMEANFNKRIDDIEDKLKHIIGYFELKENIDRIKF